MFDTLCARHLKNNIKIKKMKTKLFPLQRALGSLLSVLCCLSFTACTQEKTGLISDEEDNVLQLGASIAGLSRANEAGFEAGDSLGVYVIKWKSDLEQDSLSNHMNYADNVCFSLKDVSSQTWTPNRMIYYPADDRMLDLYAYYPFRSPAFSSGTIIDLTVATNQSAGQNYTRSDFMVARTDTVTRTPFKIPLTFNHKLSQMVFELLPGTGFTPDDLLAAKIKIINAITDATYDLSKAPTAKPVAGATRADIIPAGTWIKDGNKLSGVMAIVIPQEINSTTYFQVTIGNRVFTFKPNPANMNSGCSHKITITVNNSGLQITTDINPWNNCIPVNGEANEEFPVVYMQEFTPTGNEKIGTQVMLTDKRDNIVYRCIKMADGRWWMGENLKGRFGTYIEGKPTATYGLLYNQETAKDYVPARWSLPAKAEWLALANALGGKMVAGGEMKQAGTSLWNSPNTGATNSSNWNGLPGGVNFNNERYGRVGEWGCWWAADSITCWQLNLGNTRLEGPVNIEKHFISVRCILQEKKEPAYMQTFVPKGDEAIGTEITLIDKRDSIAYRCIKAADGHWWMSENFRYNTEGSIIYENDPQKLAVFGRLYNWQTAVNAAPENWSLPSDDDWKSLETALGMPSDELNSLGYRGNDQEVGIKLRAGNGGIKLQLGGYEWNGNFNNTGTYGRYWSSTIYDIQSNDGAWKRSVGGNPGVNRDGYKFESHLAVRYIKH